MIGEPAGAVLLLTFDHVIADGISADLVLEDVVRALNGSSLTSKLAPGSPTTRPSGMTAANQNTTDRIDIDGRRFDFAVEHGHLASAHRQPAVIVTASATDLITIRLGEDAPDPPTSSGPAPFRRRLARHRGHLRRTSTHPARPKPPDSPGDSMIFG